MQKAKLAARNCCVWRTCTDKSDSVAHLTKQKQNPTKSRILFAYVSLMLLPGQVGLRCIQKPTQAIELCCIQRAAWTFGIYVACRNLNGQMGYVACRKLNRQLGYVACRKLNRQRGYAES